MAGCSRILADRLPTLTSTTTSTASSASRSVPAGFRRARSLGRRCSYAPGPVCAAIPAQPDLTTTVVAASGAKKGRTRRARRLIPPSTAPTSPPRRSAGSRRSERQPAGGSQEQSRDRTGSSLLPNVPRFCAPVYRRITLAALQRPRRCAPPRAHRLQQHSHRVPRLPGALQPRPRDRLHRTLGGSTIFIRCSSKRSMRRRSSAAVSVSHSRLSSNVTVQKGRATRSAGSPSLPACTSSRQTGCVITYLSFTARPPGTASSDAQAPTPA